MRKLARTTLSFDGASPADATVVLAPGGRFEVAAAVDRTEQIARLEQELSTVEADVMRGEAKLANEGFVARAPTDVVAREREKLAVRTADRDELVTRLAQLRQD